MTEKKPDKPHEDPNPEHGRDHGHKPAPKTEPLKGTPPMAAGPAAEDLLTEQEKGPLDPISPSEHSPGPVETIEDQGIGPRTPYPEGNPPPPREEVTRSQAVKDVTDKVSTGPNKDQHPVKKP